MQALVKRVNEIGGVTRKAMWIGRRGCPDRFVMVPPEYRLHLLQIVPDLGGDGDWSNPWVEVKAPGEDLEPHQEREINRMRAMGELVLVIDTLALIDRYFPRNLP